MQSKTTRFELFKILDKRHAHDLLNGELYMNSLQYFRDLENPAQGDFIEGACGVVGKDRLKQIGIHFGEELLQSIDNNVVLLSDFYAVNNLFCMYCLRIDDEKKTIQKPDERLNIFNNDRDEQKVVIHIKNTEAFLHRLDIALKKMLAEHIIEYRIYGKVEYQNAWLNADGPGSRSVFHKDQRFEYQSEWRLCVLRHAQDRSAFTLSIGDLHDIAEEISLEGFLSYPETHFSDYQVAKNFSASERKIYHMFGSENAVNHLMYSYMPYVDKPTLSDQAKADWHYTQFLDLSNRQNEIDKYLASCLEKYKDLDHLELLVNHYLLNGKWVEAADVFALALREFPEEIRKNPGRFFFRLHTILMEHHEAADAGKMLKIATKDYQLPTELAQIMESDCLFALGFFDKAVTMFETAKTISDDPILNWNLAVCHFYLLHFVESQKYLNKYKTYYSSSLESNQKVRDLQRLLDCFTSNKPFPNGNIKHALSSQTWDNAIENILSKAKAKELYLGIGALWKIETTQKWDMLHNAKTVNICTATLVRIIELYRQTGDPLFYQIIEHIRAQKNVTILSPKLDYYLVVDSNMVDLLPHRKMELALYLQNQQV